MKKNLDLMVSFVLTVLAFVTGAANNVVIAAALTDGGTTESGNPQQDVETANNAPVQKSDLDGTGIATETQGRTDIEELYLEDVDKKITKIRPMSTPIDQISRYANSSKTDSFECKYYSVGTRPIKTTTTAQISKSTGASTQSFELPVADPSIFTKDDTIRCVGVAAGYNYKGTEYVGTGFDNGVPDLVLCVCGRKPDNSNPIVYAVNGNPDTSGGQNILPQLIPSGTTLIRMGKACGELDVQTGRFANNPTPDLQYCQNFMIQVEQSTFDKIAAKEVNWGFSDLEEDSIFDMRLTQELSFLFGDMNMIKHVAKENMAQWFTKGIWWMAGNTIDIGHWDADKAEAVISAEDLVNMHQAAFVGEGRGNKKKLVIAGSDVVSAFSKIESDKIRITETIKKWNLEFTSYKTGFGEFLLIHHELFDLCGMSDCAFMLDPEYLSKRIHVSWSRSVLDLKKAGIRRTDAVVLQEVSCLYLRYPKAHARMRLAQSPAVTAISIKDPSVTLTAGQTKQLEVEFTPAGATAPVTWSSSATTYAEVSDSGLLTAKSAGSATITATCGNTSDTASVTVNAAG